ncbi:hypothetical protein [Evansella halocellulosilytica]|nr:hypothetical protein [Evansella halocellulosilytica]
MKELKNRINRKHEWIKKTYTVPYKVQGNS